MPVESVGQASRPDDRRREGPAFRGTLAMAFRYRGNDNDDDDAAASTVTTLLARLNYAEIPLAAALPSTVTHRRNLHGYSDQMVPPEIRAQVYYTIGNI